MTDLSWNSQFQSIAHVPWALDGRIQDPIALEKTLAHERDRLATLVHAPKFTLLTPMWNTDPRHLEELVASCLSQSYQNWELILFDDASPRRGHIPFAESFANADPRIRFAKGERNGGISEGRNAAYHFATGNYIAILDHDDLLHPQILGIFARHLMTNPDVNFLFCNEVKVSNDSRLLSDFFTKFEFSYATLLRSNYICHFTAVHRRLFDELIKTDGVLFRKEYDGAEDHNLFLRLSRLPGFVPDHVPVFGYLWRKAPQSTAGSVASKPLATSRAVGMIQDHLRHFHADVDIRIDPGLGGHGPRFNSLSAKAMPPYKITAIVPFRDNADLTLACLASLEKQRGNFSLTVILADNKSAEPETHNKIAGWITSKTRRHTYYHLSCPGPFNYAAINNVGFAKHGGDADFFLLLNNDVELTQENAIQSLALPFKLDPKIGVSGLKLWYPGRKALQHGGVRPFPELKQSAYFRIGHADALDNFVHDEHATIAVSFACAMIPAGIYRTMGGLEEIHTPNGMGDVLACMKLRRMGYQAFYVGTSEGIHHESKTRQTQCEDYELTYVYRHFAAELRDAMTLSFGYDQYVHLNAGSASETSWMDRPLRYKVVDILNDALKTYLSPLHRALKGPWKKP